MDETEYEKKITLTVIVIIRDRKKQRLMNVNIINFPLIGPQSPETYKKGFIRRKKKTNRYWKEAAAIRKAG